MLESRHPKKKFEIGYSECVREVELFLSNLINPQTSGIDMELQKRLKEHLNKRLDDFKSIEPLDDVYKKESSEEEHTSDEPSSSPSSSVSNCLEDLPLAETEETDSADSSALNLMLKYYASDEKETKRKNNTPVAEEALYSKRLKKGQNVEEELAMTFSCPSVSSTTESKSPDVTVQLPKAEKCLENTMSKKCCLSKIENSLAANDVTKSPNVIRTNNKNSVIKRNYYSPTSSQKARGEIADYRHFETPTECNTRQKHDQPAMSHEQNINDQIPLVPRQLSNGDWALVLPASLVPSEKSESYPFSAFRLVVPTNSGPSCDIDGDQFKYCFQSSFSPLSSTLSDMSGVEFYSRPGSAMAERMEPSPDSTQEVWRPW